ncbi:propionyl-CoA synthetase [Parvibaculum sp.]|jgi:propionyl-CoA synthetase|uniref:propionyl-CoA synthetase n=1 Tax=Parvibaculum sp. TaxID=2024848 RepID=UPI000C45A3BD|nr:propionyl-CoA synthetase [Parvibaculum sp.]MAM94729.1 propionyl-CoA synthetase [Parvibaculum sp.]|tara:strand:- start:41406 stop:43313 length:1908 start_codon:yes stop_codon:yes gene_type:complete
MGSYKDVYENWKRDPEGFWAEAAKEIDWFKPATRILEEKNGLSRWYVGAETNSCWNALDRHVKAGNGDRTALVYDSAMLGRVKKFTYADLLDKVATFAGVLKSHGVEKGDRVLIYMPMVPQAAVAMLACARLGAIHSVVFGGFAAKELAARIDDARPKLIVSASCGLEPGRVVSYKPLVDKAIEMSAHKVNTTIVFQREMEEASLVEGRDFDWKDEMDKASASGNKPACVSVAATDPLYVLYTSGTTGKPKGVVRDNGGHMVALKWSMKNVYDIDPGDVFWAASDVGWVVGHSYIVYAPLFQGCTTILFEGKPVGTPDAGTFWRVIAEHGVKALFTAPTAFRAIRKEDPKAELLGNYDLSKFEVLYLAGERADPDTIQWAEKALSGRPVIDHWWQTESGWPMVANPMGIERLPVKYGSPSVPMPGYDIHVVDEAGKQVGPNTTGAIVVKLPLPPGCLPTLWENEAGFRESYLAEFPGYYKTADAGYLDEDGYLYVMSRTDDIINVAGHRLSTGGMEEVLAEHPDVAECAVIGIADAMKGQVPVGFLVLNAGVDRAVSEIEAEAVQMIRDRIGPVAAFKKAMVVKRLPKTRSGKVLRGTMRKIADGAEWATPATIDDPAILDEIASTLADAGLVKG